MEGSNVACSGAKCREEGGHIPRFRFDRTSWEREQENIAILWTRQKTLTALKARFQRHSEDFQKTKPILATKETNRYLLSLLRVLHACVGVGVVKVKEIF